MVQVTGLAFFWFRRNVSLSWSGLFCHDANNLWWSDDLWMSNRSSAVVLLESSNKAWGSMEIIYHAIAAAEKAWRAHLVSLSFHQVRWQKISNFVVPPPLPIFPFLSITITCKTLAMHCSRKKSKMNLNCWREMTMHGSSYDQKDHLVGRNMGVKGP